MFHPLGVLMFRWSSPFLNSYLAFCTEASLRWALQLRKIKLVLSYFLQYWYLPVTCSQIVVGMGISTFLGSLYLQVMDITFTFKAHMVG